MTLLSLRPVWNILVLGTVLSSTGLSVLRQTTAEDVTLVRSGQPMFLSPQTMPLAVFGGFCVRGQDGRRYTGRHQLRQLSSGGTDSGGP